MRRILITLAVTASVLAPCAAIADDATPSSSTTTTNVTATDPSSDENRMVCQREKLTGTLLPGPRVCKPLKIWKQQQQDSKDVVNGITRGNLQMNPPGG